MVQVVLLERISKLGLMGDIISVKPGYARNFLLPQRKALRATEENLKKFKEQRAKLEALNLETKQEAEKIKEEIDGRSFIVIRSASETGSLYGSVTARDAEKAMGLESLVVKRKQIILAKPIKELGLHELDISLHPEVSAKIHLNVARSSEEAEMQKSGKSIQEIKNNLDQDDKVDVTELFDDATNATRLEDESYLEEEDLKLDSASGSGEEPESSTTEKEASGEDSEDSSTESQAFGDEPSDGDEPTEQKT
jgi:large subunit ribosomal protein L9